MRSRTLATAFALAAFFAMPAHAQDRDQVELCKVTEFIQEMVGRDGPIERCDDGDAIHMQVDPTRVVPAAVAARYCDLSETVIIEANPAGSPVHIVCTYLWKWARHTEREWHPDALR